MPATSAGMTGKCTASQFVESPRKGVLLERKAWMPGIKHVLGPAFGRARVPGMTMERPGMCFNVMAVPSPIVMAGLVPAIHVFDFCEAERRGCPA